MRTVTMKLFLTLAAVVLIAAVAWPQENNQSAKSDPAIATELRNATQIFQEMTAANATVGIPAAVLQAADCIAVVPNMIKAGFIIGGRHGAGVATCRIRGKQWSPPAPFSVSGGSWGLQAGAESVDLMIMVMNQQGMKTLRSGHFKLGSGTSATAGPVGGQASASDGWNADILTYSRANGVYAGAVVKGVELQQDESATRALYGRDVPFSNILEGQVNMPNIAQAHDFIKTVEQAQQMAQSR
jgi:SH3 domain-containing YSC84-like protein 1